MSNDQQPAVVVKNVSKSFKIPLDKSSGIKQHIVNIFKSKRGYREFQALKDVSFEIKKGEFFGIVGRNGSGKSTLLKTIAGIYAPDEGLVQVNGSLTPFIELGVGFSPELSGRENVFLNGALLGFSKQEMEAMYDEIVDFAELHDFMEERLKNYSSGMQVRLAFSIAIRANTDILLLDEVLAVGDANFQQKCFDYFGSLVKTEKTVILVSHDIEALRAFCSRCALVEKGKLVMVGATEEVIKRYKSISSQELENIEDNKKAAIKSADEHGKKVVIEKVIPEDNNGEKKIVFSPGEVIGIGICLNVTQTIQDPVVGLLVTDSRGYPILATNTQLLGYKFDFLNKGKVVNISFRFPNYLTDGQYTISCAVNEKQGGHSYDRSDGEAIFRVSGFDLAHSLTHMPIDLTVNK